MLSDSDASVTNDSNNAIMEQSNLLIQVHTTQKTLAGEIPSTTVTPYNNTPSNTPLTEEEQSLSSLSSLSLTPTITTTQTYTKIEQIDRTTSTNNQKETDTKPERTATIISSVLNLVLSIIGAGTLAIPYAVSQVGYLISGILFISVAILNIFTLNLNMECASQLIPFSSYGAVCAQTIPKLKQFADVTVIIATFGILCVYLVVIGDLLPDVVSTIYPSQNNSDMKLLIDRRIWISIYLILFIIPTVYLKKMNHLRFTSFFAILCYGYIMIIVVLYAINGNVKSSFNPCRSDDRNCVGTIQMLPQNYLNIFKVLPFYIQIYSCHFNTFSVCNELKNCTMPRLNIIASLAIFISMLIYVVIGFGAYMTYGNTIDSNIILKYPKTNALLILRISLSIAIAFGYPVIIQSTKNCLSNLFFKIDDIQTLKNSKFYILTYLIVLCSFIISMITDDIGSIFGIIGSTATIIVVFILPSLFYYNFKLENSKSNKCKKYLSLLFMFMGTVLIPFCIAMQYIKVD